MKAFFDDLGAAYGVFVITLYLASVIDGIVIFGVMKSKSSEVRENAAAVLKWQKIALLYIGAAVIFLYAVSGAYPFYVVVIMRILCVLLLADGIFSTVIKMKYGAKK